MKPARFAVCQMKSDIATSRLRMPRACLVDRNRCGMHEDRPDPVRHWDLFYTGLVDADGEHQAAEQARTDVVDVQRARRHGLALHRELEQLDLAERFFQQRVGGDHRGDGRGRRTPEPGAERNPLVDRGGEPEARVQRLLHGEQRAPRGVLLRIARDVGDDASRAGDDHTRRVRALDGDRVTEHVDREAQDVEADGDVRRRGRRESGCAQFPDRAHSRAPR